MDLTTSRSSGLRKRKRKKKNSWFVRLSELLSAALSSHLFWSGWTSSGWRELGDKAVRFLGSDIRIISGTLEQEE